MLPCTLPSRVNGDGDRNGDHRSGRYLGTAAYGGANEGNWKQLTSDPEQRFIILGGKVRCGRAKPIGAGKGKGGASAVV